MIVVEHEHGFRCITQPDHAWLAGQLMELWRADGLPEHPRRAEILHAVREHDNGWRETDSAPHLDRGRRRPHDFRSLPLGERLEVWPRAVDRYARSHPYAALLIAEHAEALYGDHRDEEDFEPLFEALDPLRERLLEITGADEDLLGLDYRYLAVADQASLAICNRWSESFDSAMPERSMHGRFDPEADVLHLEPCPLVGSTTFRVPCRHIPQRDYGSDVDLAVELARARWGEVRVRVTG